jgi:hypothetical protein
MRTCCCKQAEKSLEAGRNLEMKPSRVRSKIAKHFPEIVHAGAGD